VSDRRLPVYILLDTSGSMRGEPITAVNVALQAMLSSLRKDPYALETVHLCIITFDIAAREILPLTPLGHVTLPEITVPPSGPTMMGEALAVLAAHVESNVIRNTEDRKGDWRPLLFIMTDGTPSDVLAYRQIIPDILAAGFARIVACAAGQKAQLKFLEALTPEVLHLDTMDSSSFLKFFEWVSRVIEVASGTGSSQLTALPPPPAQFQIVH
jgi:uncharacterized protein YegL